jgi:hypothetical protein
LIDNPEGDRLYKSIPETADVVGSIQARIETELLSKEVSKLVNVAKKAAPDIFGGGDSTVDDRYIATTKALREISTAKQEAVLTIIKNALEEKREKEKTKERKDYPLNQVLKANTALKEALNGLSKQVNTKGISPHLDEIEASVKAIRKWLQTNKVG